MTTGQFQKAQELFRQGSFQEAALALQDILAAEPDRLDALKLQGIVLGKLGRWEESEKLLERVLRAQPGRGETMYWLAVAKRNRADYSAAIELCRAALRGSPNPILWNELGLSHLALHQTELALAAFGNAVQADPRNGPYHFNLGLALTRLDRIHKAQLAFRESIRLDSKRVEGYLELAAILEILGQSDEAVRVLEGGAPGNFQVLTALANSTSNAGDPQKAERIFEKAVEVSPFAASSFGLWLQQQGRFEESVERFEQSLLADPVQGAPYYGLAEARVFDGLIDRASALAESSELDLKERAYLFFALGKAHERAESYETAMGFFHRANAAAYELYQAGRPFSADELRSIHDRSVADYSVSKRIKGCESAKPIFIVGMIRSGTTLLDQILSSHPAVASAGEPVFWMRESGKVRAVNQDQAADLATRYLAAVESIAGPSERITDKMPLNFAHLGSIGAVFPRAKIIHLRRSPLDTCLSIYTTFLGRGPTFAYNAANIVAYYREYRRLMDRWRLELELIEVDYEELVADKEAVTRRIVAACGLPWDDACLDHGSRAGAIRTPSKWQARQPVYSGSVGRWRRFEPWLGELGRLADEGPGGTG